MLLRSRKESRSAEQRQYVSPKHGFCTWAFGVHRRDRIGSRLQGQSIQQKLRGLPECNSCTHCVSTLRKSFASDCSSMERAGVPSESVADGGVSVPLTFSFEDMLQVAAQVWEEKARTTRETVREDVDLAVRPLGCS